MVKLNEIKKNFLPKQSILFHGVQGIGKTTLACNFPKPLLIALEERFYHLENPDLEIEHNIKSTDDVFKILQNILDDKLYKDRETIIIDSLDIFEQITIFELLAPYKADSFSDPKAAKHYGYAGGWQALAKSWQELLDLCGRLKNCGKRVIFICHTFVKNKKDPAGDDFSYYGLKLNEQYSRGVIFPWIDQVMFIDNRKIVVEGKLEKEERVVRAGFSSIYDGKCTGKLPELMPLNSSFVISKILENEASIGKVVTAPSGVISNSSVNGNPVTGNPLATNPINKPTTTGEK